MTTFLILCRESIRTLLELSVFTRTVRAIVIALSRSTVKIISHDVFSHSLPKACIMVIKCIYNAKGGLKRCNTNIRVGFLEEKALPLHFSSTLTYVAVDPVKPSNLL